MAADATVYLNNGATVDLKLTGSTLMRSMLALKLLAYGSNIKSLFYLDGVVEVNDGTLTGFIGFVWLDGTNIAYHADARKSKTIIKNSVGREAVLLNDAGLNTKGYAEKVAIISQFKFDLRISALFKSSYYANSTAYGFRLRQRNIDNTDWEPWGDMDLQTLGGAIAAQASLTADSYSASTDRSTFPFQFQPFFTNEEGTKYGEIFQLYPKAKSITFYGDANTYYIDTETIQVGTKLYDGEDFTGYHTGPSATDDFSVDTRYYWRYGYDVVNDEWIFLELVDSIPPVDIPPVNFHYTGYSEVSQGIANTQVLSGAGLYEGDLWQDPYSGVWYTGYSGVSPSYVFSGVPDDGFYAMGDTLEVTGELELLSGVNQY